MENQLLLNLFEIVTKSADGRSADEIRCLDAMKKLKAFPVNSKILIDTQVGRGLRRLTKHPRSKIQAGAVDVITVWKKIITEESNWNNKKRKSDSKVSSEDGEKRPAKKVKSDSVWTQDQITSPSSVISKPIQFKQGARGEVQKPLDSKLSSKDGEKRPAKRVESDTSDNSDILWTQDQTMSPSSVLSKPIQFKQGARGKVQKPLDSKLSSKDGDKRPAKRVKSDTSDNSDSVWTQDQITSPSSVLSKPIQFKQGARGKVQKPLDSKLSSKDGEKRPAKRVESDTSDNSDSVWTQDQITSPSSVLSKPIQFKQGARGKVQKPLDSKLSSKDGEKRPAKRVESDTSDNSDSLLTQDQIMSPSSVLSKPIQFKQGARGKVQKLLLEGLSKVNGETDESIRVTISVESALFEKLGCSTTGNCRAKYRSIIFNIKDQKNPDFRRKVLIGEIKAESIPLLTSEEMASDERRKEIQLIRNRALWDCERSEEEKATTDQFRCDRCGKRESSFYQLQTRSADEPMTTYVKCQSCKYNWKFC